MDKGQKEMIPYGSPVDEYMEVMASNPYGIEITVKEKDGAAIQENELMLTMWNRLRLSCHRSYVNYPLEAKKPETHVRRIERILKMTSDYYQRHQKTAGS